MKIRSTIELQDLLDTDRGWRIKEISHLKTLVKTKNSDHQKTFLRAGVPLLYAHWEGFVKNAATGYAAFVTSRRLKLQELSHNFKAIAAKKVLNDVSQSSKIGASISLIRFLKDESLSVSKVKFEESIFTRSNLNSSVFLEIATTIGVQIDRYETRFQFIDKELLKRRNSIAHGNYLDLDSGAFCELSDEVIALLSWFKNDIENLVAIEAYKVGAQ